MTWQPVNFVLDIDYWRANQGSVDAYACREQNLCNNLIIIKNTIFNTTNVHNLNAGLRLQTNRLTVSRIYAEYLNFMPCICMLLHFFYPKTCRWLKCAVSIYI